MSAYYSDESVVLHRGDCLDVLRELSDNSVDAVVTDPPYGIGFMGKAWDAKFINSTIERRRQYSGDPSERSGENGGYRSAAAEAGRYDLTLSGNRAFGAWCEEWTAECLRVLKPGGHLVAFGGARTWHRLAAAVEDVGFEVRDSIAWLYGSGFPKSLDVSKAIDKAAGAEPIVLGPDEYRRARANRGTTSEIQPSYDKPRVAQAEANLTAPATPDAERWQGWGTALKPAFEPIVVARKPLTGTVAANVLEWGTGALNVDGCRVESNGERFGGGAAGSSGFVDGYAKGSGFVTSTSGRWPTNVLLDGDAAVELDEQTGTLASGSRQAGTYRGLGYMGSDATEYPAVEGDAGGASRFFPTFRYQAKAPTRERVSYVKEGETVGGVSYTALRCVKCGKQKVNLPHVRCACPEPDFQPDPAHANKVAHPTVKPLALMRWLVRLVTPPGGVVLDPFAGSGTTIEGAILEGFRVIGIEREADYLPLIEARIARATPTQEPSTAAAEALALFDLEEPA